MKKFQTRLLLGLISLILFVLIGLGLLIGQLFKNYYLHTLDTRISKESIVIATHVQENGGIKHLQKEKIEFFTEVLNSRITIINMEGNIIFDTEEKSLSPQNEHAKIVDTIFNEQILKNHNNEIIEVSGGEYLHYHWNPIITDEQIEGYLFLSTELSEIKKAYKQIWWILVTSLGLALIIIIIIGSRLMAGFTKPIESATNVALELTKGNYRARTYEEHGGNTIMLSTSINRLARNLEEMVIAQEIQQDRLETLIENMGSGLLLIDSQGHVILINRTYKETFHMKHDEYINEMYEDVIEYGEITEIIEEIMMTEMKVKKQIRLSLGIERRYFEVYGVPILGTNHVWKGIVLVFHDITELKKLEQMRKDFVANVSHELKTPITSIKGFTETLLDGAKENEETLEEFLNIILKESGRLETLIQELLDLSKIEQQGYLLSLQRLNIGVLLEEAMKILSGKALDKNIELLFETEEKDVFIEGDMYRLKQVFINLLTNAISYTPNGGKVIITLEDFERNVVVKIKDTGIGITKKEIPRIFERFYRVDRARSRDSGGTGLGLAIVKHLVEAHKGHIAVESKVGVGTTFMIELPRNARGKK